ncbi:hypothetical protein BKA83DRAFT_4131347 [Pisolithus microcarpus]|nr:hypothetical protein BKA83DRAFT_4131347 [Pisolithus microcarpus]
MCSPSQLKAQYPRSGNHFKWLCGLSAWLGTISLLSFVEEDMGMCRPTLSQEVSMQGHFQTMYMPDQSPITMNNCCLPREVPDKGKEFFGSSMGVGTLWVQIWVGG